MIPALADLAQRIGPDSVIQDDAVVAAHSADQAAWITPGRALALVRARSTTDVVETMRVAAQHGLPVVTRGAGSGLSGGATAVDGCLVLSLERMDRILELDDGDQTAVVQAGVLNGQVKRVAAEHGLWYPPDPASAEFSTIGGNVATNAGGLCCLKYGATRQWVLGLEVVLGNGRVLRTGGRTVKGVAGYDLTGLFTGSEGTLGVVTEATLRLAPARAERATLVAFFPSLAAAGEAVMAAARVAVPALLEVMDQATIAAVDDWKRMELDRDAAAMVLAQSDERSPEGRREEIGRISRACEQAGASFVAVTHDAEEGEAFLDARRIAYPALERLGATLLDDVGVPRSRLAALIAECERIASRHEVMVATFGHAGDGNLHPTIVYDAHDSDAVGRAHAAFAEIVRAAVALGGTITGEHGVGRLKLPYVPEELDPVRRDVQFRVKEALDPAGLLNPGKAIA